MEPMDRLVGAGGTVGRAGEVKMIHGCRFEFDGTRWAFGGAEAEWFVSHDRMTVRPRDGITDASWREIIEQLAVSAGASEDVQIRELRRNRLGFIDLEISGVNAIEVAFMGQDHPGLRSIFPAVTGRYFDSPEGDPLFLEQWNFAETISNGDGMAFNDIDAESG